jgi:hypothetical protein
MLQRTFRVLLGLVSSLSMFTTAALAVVVPAGSCGRLGLSRAVGALSASCSSAAVGCVPVAVFACPPNGGRCPPVVGVGFSRRGRS